MRVGKINIMGISRQVVGIRLLKHVIEGKIEVKGR
jgi:hypothetical protein